MAYISQNASANVIANVAGAIVATLSKIAHRLVNFYVDIAETQGRVHEMAALQNLTDRELADKYGINRDQIAAYVLRDRIWL